MKLWEILGRIWNAIKNGVQKIISAIQKFFKAFVEIVWPKLKDMAENFKKKFGAVVKGMQTVLVWLMGEYKQVARTYAQNRQGEWLQQEEARVVSWSEVPPKIRQKARREGLNEELDITDETQKELEELELTV